MNANIPVIIPKIAPITKRKAVAANAVIIAPHVRPTVTAVKNRPAATEIPTLMSIDTPNDFMIIP